MLVKNFHFDKPCELYDLLLIIVLTITDEQFVDILCNNTIDVLGKYIDVIKHTEFTNVFNICLTIYNAYINDSNILSNLLEQFRKYKQHDITDKNEIWTEKDIVEIMFNEIKQLCNHVVNKYGYINVFDPCVGGGNLIKPFINMYKHKTNIYGCDILKHYIMLNKLELLINNIHGEFFHDDYMNIPNKDLPQNCITICNPPYSKRISNHHAIEFHAKSTQHSLLCCYIYPISQLSKPICKQYRDIILSKHDVIKVLKMGNKLFYNPTGFVGTGDISIVITICKQPVCKPLRIYDLSLYGSDRRKTPHGGVVVSKQGLKQLSDYKHGLIKSEDKQITIDDITWVDNNLLTINEDELCLLYKDIRIQLLKQQINDYITNNEHIIINLGDELDGINNLVNNMKFKQVKLTELFELVACKKYTISKTTNGNIPLYSSSQIDKPVKHVNEYSYICNDDEQLVRINKNGSVGYCFRCAGTFALTSDVLLTRLLTPITDENLMLISLQLNKQYDWKNKLTNDKFNNTTIYVSCI